MKFGVSIPFMQDPGSRQPLHRIIALAQVAEEAGFDFLSMGHHVFTPDYPTSAPFVILSAIAAETSRIELASLIYLLPLYHPVAVAEQVATLDLVSGGRAIFGVGVGYRPYEFHGFGVDPKSRGARTDEAMAIIRQGWTTGKFDFQGEHFRIPELPAVPAPTRKPHPPMWVGGVSDRALRRAARLGDAWICANMQPLDEIAAMADAYRGLCAGENRPSFVCVSRDAFVAETRAEMMHDWYGDTLNRHLGLRRMGLVKDDPNGLFARLEAGSAVDPEEFIAGRLIGGTPVDCIRQIADWRDRARCQAMLLLMNKKSSFEQLSRVIRLFGAEVLPSARADAEKDVLQNQR